MGTSQDRQLVRLDGASASVARLDAMDAGGCTCLLHDASFAFGESNMATRLVLDKFDVDFAPFATRGGLVVVIVIGSGADTRSLDTAIVGAVGVAWIIRAG